MTSVLLYKEHVVVKKTKTKCVICLRGREQNLIFKYEMVCILFTYHGLRMNRYLNHTVNLYKLDDLFMKILV